MTAAKIPITILFASVLALGLTGCGNTTSESDSGSSFTDAQKTEILTAAAQGNSAISTATESAGALSGISSQSIRIAATVDKETYDNGTQPFVVTESTDATGNVTKRFTHAISATTTGNIVTTVVDLYETYESDAYDTSLHSIYTTEVTTAVPLTTTEISYTKSNGSATFETGLVFTIADGTQTVTSVFNLLTLKNQSNTFSVNYPVTFTYTLDGETEARQFSGTFSGENLSSTDTEKNISATILDSDNKTVGSIKMNPAGEYDITID